MSNSTKCMLTMMCRSIKPQTSQNGSKKNPIAVNPSTKLAAVRPSAPGRPLVESNLDKPVNNMNELLDMCLSPQKNPKNKPKPTNT